MFGDSDSGESFEDLFKRRRDEIESAHRSHDAVGMGITWLAYTVGALIVIGIIVACCCRRRRMRGQIIATVAPPPAPPALNNPVAYPQQQYSQYPSVQVVTTYPVAQAAGAGAPYPTGAPYHPAPYPAAAPYPTGGAPYPPAAAPYPAADGYPPAAAAYPSAPSAPDAWYGLCAPGAAPAVPAPAPAPAGWSAQAMMPPSYEQATGAKHPAYNPHAPH